MQPDPENATAIADAQESRRLRALEHFQVLDTAPEPQFDRIVAMASRLFGMPISLITLLDEKRQWFKARHGVDVTETPRSMALCDHAIRQTDVMVVTDTTRDARFAANPLVTGAPFIRFYAGAPLLTRDGHALGTLCIIDDKPHELTPSQTLILADLAAIVMDELELRLANRELSLLAHTDPLTGILNRRSFMMLAERELGRLRRTGSPACLLAIDIDHFKHINDQLGHEAGDRALVLFARRLAEAIRVQDVFARLGGEEFAMILPDTNRSQALKAADRLRRAVQAEAFDLDGTGLPLTISIGISPLLATETGIGAAMRRADAALYSAKHAGRNQVMMTAEAGDQDAPR